MAAFLSAPRKNFSAPAVLHPFPEAVFSFALYVRFGFKIIFHGIPFYDNDFRPAEISADRATRFDYITKISPVNNIIA